MKSILGALVLVGGLEGVFPANSLSQQDTTSAQLIRLTLKDGSELIGTVVRGVPDSRVKQYQIYYGKLDSTRFRHCSFIVWHTLFRGSPRS